MDKGGIEGFAPVREKIWTGFRKNILSTQIFISEALLTLPMKFVYWIVKSKLHLKASYQHTHFCLGIVRELLLPPWTESSTNVFLNFQFFLQNIPTCYFSLSNMWLSNCISLWMFCFQLLLPQRVESSTNVFSVCYTTW